MSAAGYRPAMAGPPSASLDDLLGLTTSWARVGLLGFGGGSSMVPLMKAECVDLRGWMNEQEFIEALALGNALPGPIAAKMSVHVGLRVAGPLGAILAFSAVMGPSMAMMLGLAGLFLRFHDKPAVAGALAAARPVVVGMLFWTAIALAPDGVKSPATALLAALACLALLARVPPALVIVLAMLGGALFWR